MRVEKKKRDFECVKFMLFVSDHKTVVMKEFAQYTPILLIKTGPTSAERSMFSQPFVSVKVRCEVFFSLHSVLGEDPPRMVLETFKGNKNKDCSNSIANC